MKKICIAILVLACTFGMSACANKNALPTENIEKEAALKEEKMWSEQDLSDMFNELDSAARFNPLDCILMPDKASGRIGAVLFEDTEKGTVNVGFFDEEGHVQQCGTYAKAADEPEFAYMGDGMVTFKLETEDHIKYNYYLTISIDGGDVFFTAEDDLRK